MPTKTNALLEAALAYARHGWPIFLCKPSEKVPLGGSGVLEATTNLRRVEDWWTANPDANIGLDVGGAQMLVLDFDPGSNLEELEKNVGPLPPTNLRTRTPRGGEHQFFALASGELVSPSSSKLAPHVDVRSFHSYVLLPPSRTEDGAYSWEADGKPAHRTDEMVRLSNVATEKHKDRDKWAVDPDQRCNVERAEAWLRTEARPAVEGQGGDHTAYATAAYLKSLAISEDKAFELIVAHWNHRCQPPWGEDELAHLQQKVANAYRYNTSPPGNLTDGFRSATLAKAFKAVVTSASDSDTIAGGFRFTDREGMDRIPEPRWIVDGLIPDEAYVILFGPRSSLKTFVALDLALSIACGFPLEPTWVILQSGPVLFAAGEGRASLARRVAGWEALHWGGKKVKDFVLVDPVPTTAVTEENIEAFVKEALRRHPEGYRMTFIDTLGKAMTGANENDQKDASMMTALVGRLRSDLGGSVLAIAHSGVMSKDRPMGSTVFEADADTLVRAKRRGKDLHVDLLMVKQRDAPEWDKARRVRVAKVRLPSGDTTLAAGPAIQPTAEEAAEAAETEQTLLEILDREIKGILEANPLKGWTQRDLAEALAMRDAVVLGSKAIASDYLIRVRERKGTFANTAYDAIRNKNLGRWRWPG